MIATPPREITAMITKITDASPVVGGATGSVVSGAVTSGAGAPLVVSNPARVVAEVLI